MVSEANPRRAYIMQFDALSRILRVTFLGEMTDALMMEAFGKVQRFIASEGGCGAIADFSAANLEPVSSGTIRALARQPALVPNEYVRVVVARDDAAYGLARMYELLGGESRSNLHVVRTLKEAYGLLGVSSPDFSRDVG